MSMAKAIILVCVSLSPPKELSAICSEYHIDMSSFLNVRDYHWKAHETTHEPFILINKLYSSEMSSPSERLS